MFLIWVLMLAGAAVDSCDDVTEYRCANDECIPIDFYNNSINDCRDNSDEVEVPCNKLSFSCNNQRCILIEWRLDGQDDCGDGSDEAKLIGDSCDKKVLPCCDCDLYVGNSECVDDVCRCSRGFFSSPMRNRCLKRLIHTTCKETNDCSETIRFSSCQGNICLCNPGYYSSADNTTCIKRELEEECRSDSDCKGIDNSRCFNSSCQCQTGYHKVSDQCLLNLIGHPCTANNMCVIPHSKCHDDECSCSLGYYHSVDRDTCTRRKIGDRCQISADCSSVISNATCEDSYCSCPAELVVSSSLTRCESYFRAIDYFLITIGIIAIAALVLLNAFLILWIFFKFVLK